MKTSERHTLSVNASTDYLAEVRSVAAKQAEICGFPKDQISDIRLAIDEAFTNIVKHAYKNKPHQKIELVFKCSDHSLQISLFDSGHPFSGNNYTAPDVKERVKQKKRGGVGVYLIKELMDEVRYLHQDDCNEIRMIKKR